jgi:hypothetical protein
VSKKKVAKNANIISPMHDDHRLLAAIVALNLKTLNKCYSKLKKKKKKKKKNKQGQKLLLFLLISGLVKFNYFLCCCNNQNLSLFRKQSHFLFVAATQKYNYPKPEVSKNNFHFCPC